MTTDPRAVLTEIQARADGATEGPWRWKGFGDVLVLKMPPTEDVIENRWMASRARTRAEDREFIAHARTDLPAMVAALTAVLDIVDRAERRSTDGMARMLNGEPFPAIIDADEVRAAITDALGGDRG